MNPQTLTLISGVVLLLVFALVGWRARRRHAAEDAKISDRDQTPRGLQ